MDQKSLAEDLARMLDMDAEAGAQAPGTQTLQRSMFPWVVLEDQTTNQSAEPKNFDTTSAYQVVCHYGVPEKLFCEWMEKEMQESESCWSLPFTLLLVISYTGVMVNHHDCITVHSVEHSLVDILEEKMVFAWSGTNIGHKTIYDINSVVDFYSWMNKGFVQELFPPEPPRSEGFNASDFSQEIQDKLSNEFRGYPQPKYTRIIETFNYVVGGIMMRQERSERDKGEECPSMQELFKFYGRPCSHGLLYELEPDPFHARFTHEPQRIEWLHAYRNNTHIKHVLEEMELTHWIDTFTQKVEIGIPVYNGEHGVHTLVTVNFFFSRTGHIWKLIIPSSVFAEMWPVGTPIAVYIFDGTWAYCLLYIVVVELFEITSEVRRSGCTQECRDRYIGIWNMVDWISVFSGFAILIVAYIGHILMSDYNMCLRELGGMEPDVTGWDDMSPNQRYNEVTTECYGLLENAVWYFNFARILFAMYPFVIGLRLLKAFAAQPRLALLTRTIWFAGQDLLHFLFVFMSIFCTFITAAMLLFGRYIDDFATVFRATTTVMRITMGDFDWDELVYIGRIEAGIWFGLFILVVVTLLLNMIMAIIMGAYENVKEATESSDTLMTEFWQAYTRWIGAKRGELVGMGEVLRGVKSNRKDMRVMYQASEEKENLPPEELTTDALRRKQAEAKCEDFLDHENLLRVVNVEFLRSAVLKMRTEQAQTLLESALMDYYNDNKASQHYEEMTRMMHEMTAELRKSAGVLKSSAIADDISSESDVDNETAIHDLELLKRQEAQNIVQFKKELKGCEDELSVASLWIGTQLAFGDEVNSHRDRNAKDAENDSDSSASDVGDEEMQKQEAEIRQLEMELRATKQDANDELDEIAALEPELLQASEDTAENAAEFQKLRQEYLLLAQDRRNAQEENLDVDQREKEIANSRNDCFESARQLSKENEQMREQLAKMHKQAEANKMVHNDDTGLQNLLTQVEEEQAHAEHIDRMKEAAYKKLNDHFEMVKIEGRRNDEVLKLCQKGAERLRSQPKRYVRHAWDAPGSSRFHRRSNARRGTASSRGSSSGYTSGYSSPSSPKSPKRWR